MNYKDIVRFFVRYIAPSVAAQKVQVALSVMLLFLSTGLFILAMEMSRLLIQGVQQTLGDHWLVRATAALSDGSPVGMLAAIGLFCILVFSAASLASYLRDICFEEIALRLTVSLRKQLFGHLLSTRISVFRDFESSVLVKRLISDLANVRMIVVEALMLRSADAALFLGLLIYLTSLNWLLTVVSLVLIALYFASAEFLARLIGPGLYRSDVSAEQMTAHLNQAFQRMLDIKSNQRESDELGRFDALAETDYRIRKSTIKTLMLDRTVSGWLSSVLPIAITLFGGFQVLRGTMRLDEVLVFVAAINMLVHSVDRLTEIPMIISRTRVSVQNIEELFALPVEVTKQEDGALVDQQQPLIAAKDFRRRLSDNHTLHIEDLQIWAGEKVAIIGPSGCGKSSLFASLLKFDEQYQGSLKLMGMDVTAAGTEVVRANISYMHQHSMLLPDDVIANVTYSRAPGTVDLPLIQRLLNATELNELLSEDEGQRDPARLSGGQKRRLCLTRALYRNTPLLLLDEPLTGVSPTTSKNIMRHLMARPEAVVMVTHQYEDLEQFDRVILLNVTAEPEGRITRIKAQGAHRDLMIAEHDYREVVAHG